MGLLVADRVKESTTTTGTGNITLAGALTGFRTFAGGGGGAGDTCYYLIEAVDGNGVPTGAWETGLGTLVDATHLARTTVHASSNANAAVNFAAGTKYVSIDFTATHIKTFSSTPASPSILTPYGRSETYGALVFQDEFDGTSLDGTKWNDHIWYEGSDGTINYDQSGSMLRIWPQKNGAGQFVNRTIDTDGKYYQTYGYFEIRAKLPMGYGCWPAFWLFAHEFGNDRPEIDIMEAYSGGENAGNPGWSTSGNLPTNYAGNCHQDQNTNLGERKMTSEGFPAIDLSADFHHYGCRWDSGGVQFTFDGADLGPKIYTSFYNRRMYILLDLWFGSASGDPNAGGAQPPEGTGNAYLVDYVRAWSL